MTKPLLDRARAIAAQFRSHPASRGIDDIEAAGEVLYELTAEVERLRAQVAPAEPTDEMLAAGKRALHKTDAKGALEKVLRIYRAMLAASPAAPAQQALSEYCRATGCAHQAAQCPAWKQGERPPYADLKAPDVMLNGLTEAETSATASVAGLSAHHPAQGVGDERAAFAAWFSAKYLRAPDDRPEDLGRWQAWQAGIARAQAPAAEPLTGDAKRLEWLCRQDLRELGIGFDIDGPNDGEAWIQIDGKAFHGATLREAIDAALAAAKEQQ